MKVYLPFIVLTLAIGFSFAQTPATYTAITDVIANPERGLQKYSITNNNYNTTANYSNINEATLTGWRTGADKVTVIFRYFLIDAYLNSNISATYLNNIQIDFNRIRNAGLKCIVRFSYSNGQSAAPQQPVKAQILQHLLQVAPILETNKDIILTHQAGLIGTWGEFYYTNSTEFGTDGNINATQWQNRKDVIDAMLAATPIEIPIQVRYPQVKKTMYGNTQLNATTAYQNTPNARIGFFNDAFLNNWGDMGTFSVGAEDETPVGTADYTYLSNETLYTPMSGETNGLNPPRTDGANAVLELNLTNWTTLNRDYFTDCFTNWINSGHYTDILRYLGYRFVLQNSTVTLSGASLNVTINLVNQGNARLFKKRDAWFVLRNTSTSQLYSFLLNTDPRTWQTSVNITQSLDLSSVPAGSYECYLNLPDPTAGLSSRPEYSIQLANENVWVPATGFNKLNHIVDLTVLKIFNSSSNTKDNTASKFTTVYPNPGVENISIQSSESIPEEILIVNTLGQPIFSSQPHSLNSEVNVSAFTPAMYLIQIRYADKLETIPVAIK